MASMRELKGRIGSVASSEKITGAMKMISSAKMHKTELAVRRVRPFRNQIQNTINNLLASDGEYESLLTEKRAVKRVALVVLGSDEGLCGAFNINISKLLLETIRSIKESSGGDISFVIYPVGKKIVAFTEKLKGDDIEVADIPYMTAKSVPSDVSRFCKELIESFEKQDVDRVVLIYTHFISISKQVFTSLDFLPIEASNLGNPEEAKVKNKPYIFEPDGNTIYNTVLPLYLLATLQEVVSESQASEQASRVMAMQSANDNAHKLLEDLQLEYNKLRQQSITTELLDILGGKVE